MGGTPKLSPNGDKIPPKRTPRIPDGPISKNASATTHCASAAVVGLSETAVKIGVGRATLYEKVVAHRIEVWRSGGSNAVETAANRPIIRAGASWSTGRRGE
jgi:hypothetical protein